MNVHLNRLQIEAAGLCPLRPKPRPVPPGPVRIPQAPAEKLSSMRVPR
jgi:hypothetical protein